MAKQEKEVERWITVNGARIPIFKDGSIGGPKALRDKVQKKIDSDPANKTDHSMIEAENKKAEKESNTKKYKEKGSLRKQQENEIKKKNSGSTERLSVYERQLAEVNDELANAPKSKALRNEEGIKELEKKKAQLESYIAKEKESVNQKVKTDNITSAKTHKELTDKLSNNGLKLDSADAHTMENSNLLNGEKVTMYDKDGNEYRGTFNRYNDGGTEIVDIKKTKDSAKKSSLNSYNADEDKYCNKLKEGDIIEFEENGKTYKGRVIDGDAEIHSTLPNGAHKVKNAYSVQKINEDGKDHYSLNGSHKAKVIPENIKGYQSKEQKISLENEDLKEKQIKQNEAERDRLNGKKSKTIKETHDSQLIKNAKAGNISNPSKLFMPELKTLAVEFGIDPTGKSKEELANIIGSILKKRK